MKSGTLTGKKGGRAIARKAEGINQKLTPGETKFLEMCCQGVYSESGGGGTIPGRTVPKDHHERTFHKCDRCTNKAAPECSTTYLYSL